ncbi:MAG: riboflavin biosynthesis protein RibF [bacterium]
MKILLDKRDLITKDSVCAIGSFDGVHRGHQEIVRRLRKNAGIDNRVGIVTFLPLPFFVLTSSPIIYLTVKPEKERLFKTLGIDYIYYFMFTRRFAQYSAADFVDLVARQINPSTVVIGDNFHFGHGRGGSATLLRQFAKDKFAVEIMSRVKDEGTISSTRIRELLLLGHIKAANRLLGRPYTLTGRVVRGKGKGAKLGFPTINIRLPKEKLLPLDGVYKAQVTLNHRVYLSAMFCRNNLVEVHIIGFSGDLYRKKVSVQICRRIRGLERYSDDEALSAAIAQDLEAIRGPATFSD